MSQELETQTPEHEEAVKVFQARREAFIKAHLTSMGIAPQELSAQWAMVPQAIKRAIPPQWAGFGLIGSFGAGKTFAMVARLRLQSEKAVDARMAALIEKASRYDLQDTAGKGDLQLRPWPLWCNWPGESAARRALLFSHGQREVEDWILNLQDPARLVILDDIGADRATAQDWTGDTLARIVDERLRNEGPTVWTSNLNPRELVERFGGRLYSRLQALAPPIQLPKLPDMRLKTRKDAA